MVDSIEFYLDCPGIDRGIVVVAVDPCNVSVSIDIRRGTSAELMECFQDVDQAVSGVVIRPDRSDIEGRLFEADFHLFWLEVRRCAEQEGHGARCVRRGRRSPGHICVEQHTAERAVGRFDGNSRCRYFRKYGAVAGGRTAAAEFADSVARIDCADGERCGIVPRTGAGRSHGTQIAGGRDDRNSRCLQYYDIRLEFDVAVVRSWEFE